MNEPNKPELKLAMARLLPEKLKLSRVHAARQLFIWTDFSNDRAGHEVLETEWLYVMHLVEQKELVGKTCDVRSLYMDYLYLECGEPNASTPAEARFESEFNSLLSNFNRRATAMCRVKEITP